MWAQLVAGAFQGLGSIRSSGTSSTTTIIVAVAGVLVLALLVLAIVYGGDRK